MENRNTQVSRIIRIIKWLEQSRYGLTTKEIHDRLTDSNFEVKIRTVYRDIAAIQLSGIPLLEDFDLNNEGSKKWKLNTADFKSKSNNFSDREYICLALLKKSSKIIFNSENMTSVEKSFHLLEQNMNQKEREYLNEILAVIQIGENPIPKNSISWLALESAILSCINGCSYISNSINIECPKEILFENFSIYVRTNENLKHQI